MKTRKVDTVTTNDGHVRLKIYDGDLGVDEAADELIRLARTQRDAAVRLADVRLDKLREHLLP